jgi:serine protease Do
MKLGKRFLVGGFLLAAALLAVDAAPQMAFAQQKGKGGFGGGPGPKSDAKFIALFRDCVVKASKSTYRVQCDGKDTALGVCVAQDGYILTKLSDLKGKITVKLREGIVLPAQVVGKHEAHDLAMLKVEASGFTPVTWAESKDAPVGHFVASVGTGQDPVAVGVVSVAARDVPASKGGGPKASPDGPGYLGVKFEDVTKGPKITEVVKDTAAVKANIKLEDIITAVDNKVVKDSAELMDALGKTKPGDVITLKVIRGEEELELKATLGKRPPGANNNRADVQNNMGSRLSNRRTGFPTILQHDSVVLPEDCGGPLVDLEGRVVGINIARAGRVESYAIPAEVIRPLLADLMGKTVPAKQ